MKIPFMLIPMFFLAVTIFIEVVTRTIALSDNRSELAAFYDSQAEQYQLALDMQKQLEGIAADTARLAEGGNRNAIQVIEQLRASGVTINLDQSSGSLE